MKRLTCLALLVGSGCALDPLVGGECIDGWVACDGVCVDPTSDERACGGCGNVCSEGAQCLGGACTGGGCELPEVWCDAAACADLETDPANCGACGFACPEGARCAAGACVAECPPGLVDCDGACVDPSSDPRHCGGCGLGCDADDVCVGSACVADCPEGTTRCGRLCLDTTADPDHCGACGSDCDPLEECVEGACVLPCPGALQDCRTGGCVDVSRDPEHCGACGTSCGDGQSCADGACVDDCGAGLRSCDRQCVDVSSDPDHCGGCGIVCDTGICEEGRCRAGTIGHLVVIGHDYLRTRREQGRVVGNAVLIAQGDVTVVTYDGEADPTGIANAEAAVERAADDADRTVTLVPLEDPQLLEPALVAADVFLVHAQTGADADALSALGALWQEALASFLARGGVVVVLDGPATSERGGTWRIVSAAELLAIAASADVSGATLDLVDPGDAVALGMAVSYRAEQHSVSFVAPEGNGVVAAGDAPVVLHQVFVP